MKRERGRGPPQPQSSLEEREGEGEGAAVIVTGGEGEGAIAIVVVAGGEDEGAVVVAGDGIEGGERGRREERRGEGEGVVVREAWVMVACDDFLKVGV